MIAGLDKLLEGHDQAGLSELRCLLEELLGGCATEGRLIEQQMLQPRSARVFRLRFVINGQVRAMVLTRLKPEIAQRSELVDKRWLPAVGMSQHGPAVLGSVAERGGNCVWHVYDDLGQHELDTRKINRERVRAAVELISQLHTRFARHALLGEVRLHGGDLFTPLKPVRPGGSILNCAAACLSAYTACAENSRSVPRHSRHGVAPRPCCTAICGPSTFLLSPRPTGCMCA